MNDSSERQRILDKIQKCMKLSKSSEAHEAAAAFRQAQKLMANYSVSDAELMGHEIKSEQFVSRAPCYKKIPLNYAWMTSIIQKAMGVMCVMETGYANGKPRLCFRYFGPAGRPEMAVFAHCVIERGMWAAWNKYRVACPELANVRGARMGFWVGWLMEISDKVMDFGFPEEEKASTELVKQKHYGNGLAPTKFNVILLHGSMHAAGRNAGKEFDIHRPMNGAGQRRLSN
jgi:hypothetical protein